MKKHDDIGFDYCVKFRKIWEINTVNRKETKKAENY